MAITVKKSPAWVPGQGFSLTGTGPGMVVQSPGGGGGGGGGASFITSGLALHLDPIDPSSYSGSGNTWYDISGNGKHATFVSPHVVSHDPVVGSIKLGIPGWAASPASGPYIGALTDWTIFIWARKDDSGGIYVAPEGQFFVEKLTGSPHVFIFNPNNKVNYAFGYTDLTGFNGGNSTSYVTGKTARPVGYDWAYEAYTTPQQSITIGTWACYAVVKSGLTLSLYVNGSLVGSPTAVPDSDFAGPGVGYYINNDQWSGGAAMHCSIGPLAVYNRGLTSGEVTQNWDATRSRFGM